MVPQNCLEHFMTELNFLLLIPKVLPQIFLLILVFVLQILQFLAICPVFIPECIYDLPLLFHFLLQTAEFLFFDQELLFLNLVLLQQVLLLFAFMLQLELQLFLCLQLLLLFVLNLLASHNQPLLHLTYQILELSFVLESCWSFSRA
jgi:hypothetical protein